MVIGFIDLLVPSNKFMLSGFSYLTPSLADKRGCAACDKVLQELESIDDDTARFGVHLVKVADKKLARSYGVKIFPALTYFRNAEPIHYEGEGKRVKKIFSLLKKRKIQISFV